MFILRASEQVPDQSHVYLTEIIDPPALLSEPIPEKSNLKGIFSSARTWATGNGRKIVIAGGDFLAEEILTYAETSRNMVATLSEENSQIRWTISIQKKQFDALTVVCEAVQKENAKFIAMSFLDRLVWLLLKKLPDEKN